MTEMIGLRKDRKRTEKADVSEIMIATVFLLSKQSKVS